MVNLAFDPEKVDRQIGPLDSMFDGNIEHYLRVGLDALRCIDTGMSLVGQSAASVHRILDLPSGHGRVLRWFKSAFPEAEITACDVDRPGVDFCAKQFGASPVYSVDAPKLIPLEGSFDLIWVGSMFTHLDRKRWIEFLQVFEARMTEGALLVFTSHGRYAYQRAKKGMYNIKGLPKELMLAGYRTKGFGYADYGADFPFGVSLSSPSWVLGQVLSHTGLRIVNFTEKGWDNHQDVVILSKNTGFTEVG